MHHRVWFNASNTSGAPKFLDVPVDLIGVSIILVPCTKEVLPKTEHFNHRTSLIRRACSEVKVRSLIHLEGAGQEPRSYHTMQPSTSGYQPTPRPSALGYQSASRPPSMGYQSNFEHDFSVSSPSASDNTMNSVLSDDINEHLFDN
ncbi:hypothetical protein ACJJTC_014016 [Scirpophaga incertulas]